MALHLSDWLASNPYFAGFSRLPGDNLGFLATGRLLSDEFPAAKGAAYALGLECAFHLAEQLLADGDDAAARVVIALAASAARERNLAGEVCDERHRQATREQTGGCTDEPLKRSPSPLRWDSSRCYRSPRNVGLRSRPKAINGEF